MIIFNFLFLDIKVLLWIKKLKCIFILYEMTKKRKAFDRELQEIANVQTLQYRALLALQELNTKTIKN